MKRNMNIQYLYKVRVIIYNLIITHYMCIIVIIIILLNIYIYLYIYIFIYIYIHI